MAAGHQLQGCYLTTVSYPFHECPPPLTETTRSHPSGADNQAEVLQQEGVVVTTGSLGELQVDFGVYGWFPRQLPSEAAAGISISDDDEE